MARIIVTHFAPDTDAMGAVWLLKRFDKSFLNAKVEFVPAGTTYKNEPIDSNPDIVHVDTGLGRFDHHQISKRTSAVRLVWESLDISDEALERLVAVLNDIDNAVDLLWPESYQDRFELSLSSIVWGWKQIYSDQDQVILEWGLNALDGAYQAMKDKVEAEKLLKGGEKFETRWGEAIALKTGNSTVLTLGEKQGYTLVVIQEPKSGHLRIYSRPDRETDLTGAYEELKKRDSAATWFLHSSKKLLLNGSRKDPNMKPTKLGLEEIVEVLQKV